MKRRGALDDEAPGDRTLRSVNEMLDNETLDYETLGSETLGEVKSSRKQGGR
jgi:hypothetical protein